MTNENKCNHLPPDAIISLTLLNFVLPPEKAKFFICGAIFMQYEIPFHMFTRQITLTFEKDPTALEKVTLFICGAILMKYETQQPHIFTKKINWIIIYLSPKCRFIYM